jgi:hypothetical protein
MSEAERLLVSRRGHAEVDLMDPETGSATDLGENVRYAYDPGPGPVRTPDGRRVFGFGDGHDRCRFARLDRDGGFALTAWCDQPRLVLGCPTDDEVVVHDGCAIWRLRFGSDAREEIWRVR